MKDYLIALFDQWKAASGATRGIVVLAAASVVALIFWISSHVDEPHFKLLYSNQDEQHAAAIQRALAGGGVRYQASQPPGPYSIWVDDAQYYQAQNLVALSGALSSAPTGIPTTENGASQVFLSASERAQHVLKREWQELEKQLQELDFVQRAHVSTSTPDSSPLRKSAPPTVAVTLAVAGNGDLSRAQAETVAKLVRFRFNVPPENVVISDQFGRSLYDGANAGELGAAAATLLEHRTRFENELTSRTNTVLDRIFGPGMAYVVLSSDWRYEERERVKEAYDPKNIVALEKTETKSSTPQGSTSSGGGGVTDIDIASPGAPSSGSTANSASPGATPAEAKTSETRTSSVAGKETELLRTSTPTLTRMTVSLFVDESLKDKFKDAEKLTELQGVVKNAVGFDDRRDAFSSMFTAFASIARDEKGAVVPPPKPEVESAPSPMIELVLQRGVEIAAALVFLFVLLKALKSTPRAGSTARGGGVATVTGPGGVETIEAPVIDQNDPKYLEALAKRQIEELVKTEPEKVGSMLSRWISDQETLART